jgi:hypothetical protein
MPIGVSIPEPPAPPAALRAPRITPDVGLLPDAGRDKSGFPAPAGILGYGRINESQRDEHRRAAGCCRGQGRVQHCHCLSHRTGSAAAFAKESAARPPTARSAGCGLGRRGGAFAEERGQWPFWTRSGADIGVGIRRTLEWRVRTWRALNGAELDVIFRQEHSPCRLRLSDFTEIGRTAPASPGCRSLTGSSLSRGLLGLGARPCRGRAASVCASVAGRR